jgi:hypothetical protein
VLGDRDGDRVGHPLHLVGQAPSRAASKSKQDLHAPARHSSSSAHSRLTLHVDSVPVGAADGACVAQNAGQWAGQLAARGPNTESFTAGQPNTIH